MNKSISVNSRITRDELAREKILDVLEWESIKMKCSEISPEAKLACVAKMEYSIGKYWAVSGVDEDEEKCIEALKAIINVNKSDICYICNDSPLRDKVKFYIYSNEKKEWQVFSYSDYLEQIKAKNKKRRNDRLFSCCERKLIAKIVDYSIYFKIYVNLPPCEFCENAFTYIKENYPNASYDVLYTDDLIQMCSDAMIHLKKIGLID